MNYKEIALKLGKAENTILHNWKRTKATLEKKGIIIEKVGCGKTADYTIEYKINKEDAET